MTPLRTLGDYTIAKQIGSGSLGAVYLAEHRFMQKQYVLKVLAEDLSSDRSFIQRFEEDIALLSTLDHPNIVKIHNISFAQGRYFLVNDCIVDSEGETTNLAQYFSLKNKYLSDNEVISFLKSIASALEYAHSRYAGAKTLAHRNLKLNNILVGKNESNNLQLYLSDFGLARIIGPSAVLTRIYKAVADAMGLGWIISSPEKNVISHGEGHKLSSLHASFLHSFPFLAPEQKRIEWAEKVTHKADIFAFGVLSYYLLTGEFPEGHFTLPSKLRSYSKIDWDQLVCCCLDPNPEKRPDKILPLLQENISEFKDKAIELPSAARLAEIKQEALLRKEVLAPSVVTTKQAAPLLQPSQIERPITDPNPAAIFQIDTQVKHYTPEKKEIKNIEPLLTEMALIAGREFMRGSNEGNRDEMPLHQIRLDTFALDIHPVTNEQFVRFLEVMGGEKDSNHRDIIRLRDSRIKRSAGKLTIESGYTKHPVVGVTWYGAIAYAKWIGKRLPTEAEWEIAARGGVDDAIYPTGKEIEKSQANFFSSDTTAVMSYSPNSYGLFDMAGNIYEWCQDWYGYNYYETSMQEPDSPKGPLQGVYRVLRGGCWKSLKEDLHCSRRHRNNPGTVNSTYGFRCAADIVM